MQNSHKIVEREEREGVEKGPDAKRKGK